MPDPLEVTGVEDAATVRALRWYLDAPGGNRRDRMLNRDIQTWVGRPRTGRLSRNDVRAVERRIGARVDGIWDADTVAALQRWLNRRIAQAA